VVFKPKNQVLYVLDCSKLNRHGGHAALMFFEEWNFNTSYINVVWFSFPCL